jgi:hypothetical protein
VTHVVGIEAAYIASRRAGYEHLLPPAVLEAAAKKRAAYDWASAIRTSTPFRSKVS